MIDYAYYFDDFAILLCLFATFVFFVLYFSYYCGVFTNVAVRTKKPPFKEVIVAYKFTRKISEAKMLLSEIQSIVPDFTTFASYHEDLLCETGVKLAATIGTFLKDADWTAEESVCNEVISRGYKLMMFPDIDYAVVATFPYRSWLSISTASYKIYPKFKQYIKEKKVCAHPMIEIFGKKEMHFIAPLSHQFDFYTPEAIPEYEHSDSEFETEDIILPEKKLPNSNGRSRNGKSSFKRNIFAKACVCKPGNRQRSCDYCKRTL